MDVIYLQKPINKELVSKCIDIIDGLDGLDSAMFFLVNSLLEIKSSSVFNNSEHFKNGASQAQEWASKNISELKAILNEILKTLNNIGG